MLNPFPIMFLALLAHAILRTVAGGLLLVLGMGRIRALRAHPTPWLTLATLSVIEIVSGTMLILGFLTQIAALIVLLYALIFLLFHKKIGSYMPSPSTQVLLTGIALSLFITGAGAFAFDMPF